MIKVESLKFVVILLFFCLFWSQAKAQDAHPKKGFADPSEFVLFLQNHNQEISSYLAGISTSGNLNRNNFKALGYVWADHKLDFFKLKFVDLVFKSPISIFLKKGDKVYLSYPPQKHRLETTVEKFQPMYEAGIPLGADLLVPLLKGHFFIPPVIVSSERLPVAGKDQEKFRLLGQRYDVDYLVSGKDPVLFLITVKKTGQKVMFVYQNYRQYGMVKLPGWIKVQTLGSGNFIIIQLLWLRINAPVPNIWYLG